MVNSFKGIAAAAIGLSFTLPGCADAQVRSAPASQRPDDFAGRALAEHNRYRAAAGVSPLRWDPRLAAAAAAYGRQLAARGQLAHSPRATRPGQSENLWRGTAGAYSLETMIDHWARERSYFRSGSFPNVSTSGNWLDVSHYTQMIWPTTTQVGCAVQRSRQWDYLICRYSPKGNIDGRRVP